MSHDQQRQWPHANNVLIRGGKKLATNRGLRCQCDRRPFHDGAVASINDWLTRCASHLAASRCKRVHARLYDSVRFDNVFSNTRLLCGEKSGCVLINRFTDDSNVRSGFLRVDTSLHNTTLVM